MRTPPSSTATLAEDRAGPELGDRLAVDDHRQHAVEQEEQRVARVALLGRGTSPSLTVRISGRSPPA